MDLILEFTTNFLKLLDAMSIYVIVGLFIAGILKQLIPDNFISSHLGKNSTMSVIKATIFGIPLPVCSCSVIPLAQGLKKEGAS
ncbi:MAG: permease, partial [Arcobacter sp.]